MEIVKRRAPLAWKWWKEALSLFESYILTNIMTYQIESKFLAIKKIDFFSHLYIWYNFGRQKFADMVQ